MPRDLANLRAWQQANRAKLRQNQRTYYKRHQATIAAKKATPERKAREAQRARERRAANPEPRLAYEQAYREAHREAENAKAKRSYWRHRDRILARLRANRRPPTDRDRERGRLASRLQRLRHPEKVAAWINAWNAAHAEQRRARIAAWAKANPERRQAINHRRRARKAHAPRNDLTLEQWETIQAAQGHRCAYCGKRCKGKLTRDHISPLGPTGPHTLHNIVAACRSCNAKKQRGKNPIPVQPLLL